MKLLSKITSSLLALSSLALVNCDSDTPLPFGDQLLSDTTETDEFVEADELFTFEDLLFLDVDEALSELRFTSTNVALSGEITYNYVKTSEFNAEIEADIPADDLLEEAINQLFSLDNANNAEVRALLLVPDIAGDAPELTFDERTRLIELLNVAGAAVIRNPDDDEELLVLPNLLYTITSTSTVEDRLFGLIGGTYSFQASSQVIIYDIVELSDGEENTFRFYFPIVSSEVREAEVFELGTYTLQLVNEIGF